MASEKYLLELKNRLAPRLLAVDGVSGVAIGEGGLSVYLARDHSSLRQEVEALVQVVAPGCSVRYIVAGDFRAQ